MTHWVRVYLNDPGLDQISNPAYVLNSERFRGGNTCTLATLSKLSPEGSAESGVAPRCALASQVSVTPFVLIVGARISPRLAFKYHRSTV